MIQKLINNINNVGLFCTLRLIRSTLYKKFNTKTSYSQYNEDIIIDKLLDQKKDGFYIDVGAFDPIVLNNTKLFSDRGWKGINIDPNPKTISKFELQRPKDINLNIGLSSERSELRAVLFEGFKSYTMTEELIKQRLNLGEKIKKDISIKVETLNYIFKKYVPENTTVDFISIDTEGMDLEVLKGNNWNKNRPKIICIETLNDQRENKNYRKEIHKFLKKRNYKILYDTGLNSIFFNTKSVQSVKT